MPEALVGGAVLANHRLMQVKAIRAKPNACRSSDVKGHVMVPWLVKLFHGGTILSRTYSKQYDSLIPYMNARYRVSALNRSCLEASFITTLGIYTFV